MTSRTIVGLLPTERVSSTLCSLPVGGILLLPGNGTTDIWRSCKTISMQTRKPGYVQVNVDGLSNEKLISLRNKAQEHWVSGIFVQGSSHGSSIERAVRILRSENRAIGCTLSLAEKCSDERLAEIIASGCASVLIEPGAKSEVVGQFLQDLACRGQRLRVLYGIRPVMSANRTIVTELPKDMDVYADCSGLSESSIEQLMQELSIGERQ